MEREERFERAIKKGSYKKVKKILKKRNHNQLDDYRVKEAVGYGNVEIVKLLIENGFDINCHSSLSYDPYQRSTLMIAVKSPNKKMVRLLIDMGVDINFLLKDKYNYNYHGRSALDFSIMDKYREISKILIENGAIIYFHTFESLMRGDDYDRELAYYILSNRYFEKDLSRFFNYALKHGSIKIAKFIIDNPATDLNKLEYNDKRLSPYDFNIKLTCLMRAIIYKQDELIERILDRGVDLDIQDNSGNTALMYAIEAEQIETVKLLIQKGANVNICNKYRYSP